MFDLERFIADCRAANEGDRASRHVRVVVARAVAEPEAVTRALGEPEQGRIRTLYASPELTIINVLWRSQMVLMPHDHRMWGVVGVYRGREDNIFWRRLADAPDGRIEAAGAKSIGEGEAVAYGPDLIHSVVNPVTFVTAGIHVYGGDFFGIERSEWDPDALTERPYDRANIQRRFAGAD